MKLNAEDLKKFIREVVREVVKETIAEELSERYIRGLVKEASSRNDRSDLEIRLDDDGEARDRTPHALPNSDAGIYQKHPTKKESIFRRPPPPPLPPVLAKDELSSIFFEGTRPIDEIEAEHDEGVPLETPQMEELTAKWKHLVEGSNSRAAEKTPMKHDPAAVEARLKARREALEVPVNARR